MIKKRRFMGYGGEYRLWIEMLKDPLNVPKIEPLLNAKELN